ncbi:MAG: toll/interleukin-1 receptor domain-containing protein [Parasphingorhabdus sp.]|uniref:toll/interleukin-1 receptor domain-containing protein n=1 Tax=Parasphingorhabdus sp. TaxID=2709688 RepID=UPI0032652B6A
MADIFISYSRNDRERCTAIRDILESLKVSVWFDAGIGAGSSFDREIEREIEAAKALLVLWTEESVESDWVRNEARTGKERSGLIAVQLRPCTLPLEFRSVQAEVLPEGAEGTDNAIWIGILERIGELLDRPGLVEYTRLKEKSSVADWKNWLARFPKDPLVPDVIDNLVASATPDMSQQLAGERAKRSAMEAELAELAAASKAQSGEFATGARELVRLRRELDEAQSGQHDAESELARFREASGGKNNGDGELSGLGIVLNDKIAIYLAALLWIVAIRFCWDHLNQLIKGYGALGDVFWIIFGIMTLAVPATLLTIKILRKRKAMQREEETLAHNVAD